MKIKNYLYILTCSLTVLTGCERELDTEGVSRITTYPAIELTGNQWNRIDQGDTWVDPGAKAMEGTTEIEVEVGGDVVDPNTPGVYTITYTAFNKDGFSITAYRYVGVISPNVAGVDLTGAYKRNAGLQGISTVTQVDENLYTSDNVGGVEVPGPETTVYFYHYDTGLLGVPFQFTEGGAAFSCTNATVNVGVSYSWAVVNPGYGTALRTFIKQ